MNTVIWIAGALVAAGFVAGVVLAARRSRRTYVPATPVTTSVPGPVEEILESPRHAADTRAALLGRGGTGTHRRPL